MSYLDIFVRHTECQDPRFPVRHLTERGVLEAGQIATSLQKSGLPFGLIVSSPAPRCVETARRIQDKLPRTIAFVPALNEARIDAFRGKHPDYGEAELHQQLGLGAASALDHWRGLNTGAGPLLVISHTKVLMGLYVAEHGVGAYSSVPPEFTRRGAILGLTGSSLRFLFNGLESA